MPVTSAQSQDSEETEIVTIDMSDPAAQRAALESGGIMLAEYEDSSLWQIPAVSARTNLRPAVVQMDNTILFRGLTLQPGRDEPAVPSSLQQRLPAGPALWIVQFAGPILPEWLEDLQSSGLEIVAYLPHHAYIVWGEQPSARLQSLSAQRPVIQWQGAYHPYYRLAPSLRPDDARSSLAPEMVDVTVQLYQTASVTETISRLKSLADAELMSDALVGNLVNVSLRVPFNALTEIASVSEVFNVEPYVVPELMDEIQGQILAGNINSAPGSMLLPSGPGYLAWLNAKGFPTDPTQYPPVDVFDDGLDTGNIDNILHPDFYLFGQKIYGRRVQSIQNCTSDPLGNAVGGHGNLNAGIVAGYNASRGAAYQDAYGYSYGLGISPYGTISSTKIFNNMGGFDLSRCGNSYATLVENAYRAGARITSNSWGANVAGEYTAASYAYDYLTRDASFSQPANQEMLHIVAAGNRGPGAETVGAPGTAKNILTVGATENVRDQDVVDGCLEGNANNANDMAGFSSRGPAMDGRIKPDIVAPGTHVMGPASQDPGFDGTGVCGGSSSRYYPSGQTLYTWSTGTSHSTPAIAGAAQLNYNYYQRVLKPGAVPSPAMQKALMLNTPRYLQGLASGDTLPSNAQGWGMANLGMVTDGTPRILKDQEHIFTASGQSPFEITGFITDPNKPFHVSLVWTDAPGNTAGGIAAVNNLDLEVVAGGQVYKGNVFKGNTSVTGGTYDTLNNVENVFLPAGTQGMFRVRVNPQLIAGNSIFGNATSLDQDFALVVYNGSEAKNIPVLLLNSVITSQVIGNGDSGFDPGETFSVQVELGNLGTTSSGPVTAVMTTSDPLVLVSDSAVTPAIVPGTTQKLSPSFHVTLSSLHACAGVIPLYLNLTYGPYRHAIRLPDLAVGTTSISTRTFTTAGLPVDIPNGMEYKLISLAVPNGYLVNDVDVQVSITHAYVSDLLLVLNGPMEKTAVLTSENGTNGDNYTATIFDDEANTPINNGRPPFTGRYRPEQPLSVFDGLPSGGTWILEVYDTYPAADAGRVTDFKLVMSLQQNQPTCAAVHELENKHYLPVIGN